MSHNAMGETVLCLIFLSACAIACCALMMVSI